MEKWKYVLGALALILLVFTVNTVKAVVEQSDNLGVPVPANNGTSTLLNVTARMQQYVGFFGNVISVVRLNVTNVTGSPNYQLYNKTATSGDIYFFQSGDTPTTPFINARNNSETDGNFSLTGYYVTGNHYEYNESGTICGSGWANYLNTTDGYRVGIFRDSSATPNYFLCTDISQVSSVNGFGNVNFEVIVPKTSTYSAYDVWIDLTAG